MIYKKENRNPAWAALREMSKAFPYTWKEFRSHSRIQPLAMIRTVGMVAAKHEKGWSHSQIAEVFNRDRTRVVQVCREFEDRYDTDVDKDYVDNYEFIREIFDKELNK